MKNAGKVFVGAALFMGGCALFLACGSTTSSPAESGGDSGADALSDGADVAKADALVPDATPDSATCDLSTNLTTDIPDAALDDSGTRSTGLCLACVNQASTCKSYIDQCDQDCDCKGIAGSVLTCIAKGGSQTACALMAAGVSSSAQALGFELLGCVQTNCKDQCTPQVLTDAGADGSDDAASDADAN